MDLSSFSQRYAEARQKFLQACAGAGLAVESHVHPLRGRDGEELAMDVARLGAADAANLLILSSACHGAEGFCGSGIQVGHLRDALDGADGCAPKLLYDQSHFKKPPESSKGAH